MARSRGVTVVLVPDRGSETRSVHLSSLQARLLLLLGVLSLVGGAVLAGSWWFLAARARQVTVLEARVDSLEAERERVVELARQLSLVEAEYDRIRSLFGYGAPGVASDLWLPPPGPGAARARLRGQEEQSLPTSWPLTQAGIVTQPLAEGGEEDHPGLDVAVPTDSYVRAAGAGRVVRAGEDPIYGRFVVLDHGGGYETVYAHASTILVERGQSVRQNEVIALSGSTGRSTAPHLHFEILKDGVPVDPLSMVTRPGSPEGRPGTARGGGSGR